METPAIQTTELYIPPLAQKLSDLKFPQIRLGLQGPTGTGKTFSALTFPNPVVIDIDNNLARHIHRTDIIRLPFCDDQWIKSNFKQVRDKYPARDAIRIWLETEAIKLKPNQTLVLDSWTTLQDAFDRQADPKEEPVLTAKGEINDYAFWDKKIDYAQEILTLLKGLKCHVVVTFHEQEFKDAQGNLTSKIEPLMKGKFVKKIGLYFVDYFRCVTKSKLDPTDKKTIIGADYFWQTKSTGEIGLKSRLDLPMLIEPNFTSLSAYFSPNTSTQTKATT